MNKFAQDVWSRVFEKLAVQPIAGGTPQLDRPIDFKQQFQMDHPGYSKTPAQPIDMNKFQRSQIQGGNPMEFMPAFRAESLTAKGLSMLPKAEGLMAPGGQLANWWAHAPTADTFKALRPAVASARNRGVPIVRQDPAQMGNHPGMFRHPEQLANGEQFPNGAIFVGKGSNMKVPPSSVTMHEVGHSIDRTQNPVRYGDNSVFGPNTTTMLEEARADTNAMQLMKGNNVPSRVQDAYQGVRGPRMQDRLSGLLQKGPETSKSPEAIKAIQGAPNNPDAVHSALAQTRNVSSKVW